MSVDYQVVASDGDADFLDIDLGFINLMQMITDNSGYTSLDRVVRVSLWKRVVSDVAVILELGVFGVFLEALMLRSPI